MSHCTASGCHGPQSETSLRLFRTSASGATGRRITQRNLYAVLQFVNQDNPLASRLLTVPSSPHGTAQSAIFTERQAGQYQRLLQWVNQLARQTPDSPAVPAPTAVADSPASAVPVEGPLLLPQNARRARQLPAAGPNQSARRGDARPATKLPGDASPASYNQPADPFDPEVFNRRYAPDKKQPAGENPPAPQ